ncbi:MAG: alpha amylase C-terminal domain-containing protein, partial [Candidatus Competibacter sp.]|nr:alpha amylase C-terminal domain-containing protein [Candidatus Competibacter sp.]
ALRSRAIEIVHAHDANRVLAFRRWDGNEELLVIASLNNRSFADGYRIENARLAGNPWREIFNGDAPHYGGGLANVGAISPGGNALTVRLPANSVLVFQRQ